MKNYFAKNNEAASSPKLPISKSKSSLNHFEFPYIKLPILDDLKKKHFSLVQTSRKSLNKHSSISALKTCLSQKSSIRVSNAYQDLIKINKRKTSNILENLQGSHQISSEDLEADTKAKPPKSIDINKKIAEIPIESLEKNSGNSVPKHLTSENLKEITYEFCKPPSARNLVKLATYFKTLSFFSKFSEPIITEIIKKSELETFEEGEAIIKQGDLGDKMFIILTGIVNVIKRASEFGGIEIQVNTLYQGETFGEMALLAESDNESLQRAATCVASQKTTVITMSKKYYKHILLYMMKNDIHGKAAFFCSLPLFPGTDHYSMVPLAANIEPSSFTINEIILEAGDIPQGLYIIYEGSCSIKWEGYFLRKKIGSKRAITRAPKQFLTDRVVQINKKKPKIFLDAFDPLDSQHIQKASQYLKTDNLNVLMGQYEVYKKSIELSKLKSGDFFGGRAILFDKYEPAKLTVVSDSLNVKIFIFKFNHFKLLPETSLDTFRKILEKADEPDCPKNLCDKELKKSMENWENFKLSLTAKPRLNN